MTKLSVSVRQPVTYSRLWAFRQLWKNFTSSVFKTVGDADTPWHPQLFQCRHVRILRFALVLTMHVFPVCTTVLAASCPTIRKGSVRERAGQDMWVAETVLWSWTYRGTKPARSCVDTTMWARLAFSLSVVLVLMCSFPNVSSSVSFRRPSKVSRRHLCFLNG